MLTTARLVLRRWHPGDLPALTVLFAEPAFSWHPFRRARTPAEAEAFLTAAQSHWSHHGIGRWAVCDRGTGHLIGYCGAATSSWPTPGTWDLGWRLSIRGRGLGHEAATAAIADCRARGLTPLTAVVEATNTASLHLCHKLGLHELRTEPHPAHATDHTIFALDHPDPGEQQ